ncbi:hypothetical protein PGB34_11000 [Xenophilus arseniciresistens]|uniref:Uncharacterized protein n=1 Tax=Xenophilus arseniciresistens TaxID=1283306 RepID=A0AAE3N957_9BURK|nr:hypothetical protein [Xenophilus arseniciresistens]MDA7416893.1 hypothetical protein [Xenophilus arseniciresistens]
MSNNNSSSTSKRKTPARWQGSESALHAVQVAFDVEIAVMEAIRIAAFHENVSTSQQIRSVLGLPVAARPKRPRLTVTLDESDYALLAQRYGLAPDDRLGIKEAATRELIAFVPPPAPPRTSTSRKPRKG